MLASPHRKDLLLRLGLAAFAASAGVTLLPAYHGSSPLHFLAGLGMGVSVPFLLFRVYRAKRAKAT